MATPKKKKETFNRFGLHDSLHKQHRCFSDSRVHGDMKNIATCRSYL